MEKKYLFSNRDLRKLIIPLMVEQLLAISVGLIDSIMIAGVGEAALSGVSLVENIIILVIYIFAALSTGGAVVAGQYLGEKNREKACYSADQLVQFTVVISIIMTVFIFFGRSIIMKVVFGKAEASVMGYADTYLMIVSLSIPFIALYNSCAALFRAMGNSKITMNISLIMNGINIAGNAILIYGFKMEVAGAAIATLASRIVAGVIVFILLRNQEQIIHLKRSFKPKFDWFLVKRILYIGIPTGMENSMFQFGKVMVLSLVTTFGTVSIAANAVANTIALFQILPGISIGLAIISVISVCVGAKDFEQVHYYTKKLVKLTHLCILGANVIIFCLLPFILKIYNLSSETAGLATQITIFYSFCSFLLWPIAFAIPHTLRSANDVRFTMVISIFSMWVFRYVFSYILGRYFGLGVFGVWVAMSLDWLFRAICFTVRYKRGKWIHQEA